MDSTKINHKYRGETIREDHWADGNVTFLALVLGGIEVADLEAGKRVIDEHHARFPEHEIGDDGKYVLDVPRDMFGIPMDAVNGEG